MSKLNKTAGQLDVGARQRARHYAVQALYQRIMAGSSPSQIEAEFRVDNDMSDVDLRYFHDLVFEVIAHSDALDALFTPHLDRALGDIDPVSLAQLRLASYELQSRPDVPWRVVIEEAVRLSKRFGPTDSFKFLNGVLDKLARQLRSVEMQARG